MKHLLFYFLLTLFFADSVKSQDWISYVTDVSKKDHRIDYSDSSEIIEYVDFSPSKGKITIIVDSLYSKKYGRNYERIAEFMNELLQLEAYKLSLHPTVQDENRGFSLFRHKGKPWIGAHFYFGNHPQRKTLLDIHITFDSKPDNFYYHEKYQCYSSYENRFLLKEIKRNKEWQTRITFNKRSIKMAKARHEDFPLEVLAVFGLDSNYYEYRRIPIPNNDISRAYQLYYKDKIVSNSILHHSHHLEISHLKLYKPKDSDSLAYSEELDLYYYNAYETPLSSHLGQDRSLMFSVPHWELTENRLNYILSTYYAMDTSDIRIEYSINENCSFLYDIKSEKNSDIYLKANNDKDEKTLITSLTPVFKYNIDTSLPIESPYTKQYFFWEGIESAFFKIEKEHYTTCDIENYPLRPHQGNELDISEAESMINEIYSRLGVEGEFGLKAIKKDKYQLSYNGEAITYALIEISKSLESNTWNIFLPTIDFKNDVVYHKPLEVYCLKPEILRSDSSRIRYPNPIISMVNGHAVEIRYDNTYSEDIVLAYTLEALGIDTAHYSIEYAENDSQSSDFSPFISEGVVFTNPHKDGLRMSYRESFYKIRDYLILKRRKEVLGNDE